MSEASGKIREEVADFIRHPDGRFPALSVALFAQQFETNRPYRAYCESLGATPDRVSSWEEIPAVPADAFKTGMPLCCFPPGDAARIFLTSGTTAEVRGRHFFPELDTHALSIRRGWEDAGLPDLARRFFLSPQPEAHPDSSLTFMFETLAAGSTDSRWLLDPDGRLRPGLLESAAEAADPVLLFGTALSLLHLLEALPGPVPLPAGSWIFQTGGYKGQTRHTHPGELAALAAATLRVPPTQIINEYGMTELSSQCYAVGPDAPHRTPPWMKARVIDPETGRQQAPGEAGYLVFYDLANLGSVQAVRTQDFGRAIDDRTFHLDGRDPGALPRGCSRSSDAPLSPLPRA